MAKLFDRVGQATATTGTGTLTLGAVITDSTNGDLATFADMGAVATDVVNYLIVDGSNWEIGTGTLGGTGPGFTLTRTVAKSKISGTVGTTALTLSGTAKVYSVPANALANTWSQDVTFSGNINLSGSFLGAGNFGVGDAGILYFGGGVDTRMQRDGANYKLALRNSTNAMEFRVYGTDDGSQVNYSRLSLKHAGGTAGATIATEAGGTGTAGNIALSPGSGKVTFKAPTGQKTQLQLTATATNTNGEGMLEIYDETNTLVAYIRRDGAVAGQYIATSDNATAALSSVSDGLNFHSSSQVRWSNDGNHYGTKDLSVGRIAAGILGLQDGSGNYTAARAAAFEQAQGTLTSGATIAWDVRAKQSAILTLGTNATLSNPTNMVAGTTYILVVKQDATGSRTLAYGTAYKWPGGAAPVLSTAANAVDVLTFIYDGTSMLGVAQKAFA